MLEEDVNPIIPTSISVAIEVEKLVDEHDMGYLEALSFYCEEKDIEPKLIKRIIPKPLLEKITAECIQNNLLVDEKREDLSDLGGFL